MKKFLKLTVALSLVVLSTVPVYSASKYYVMPRSDRNGSLSPKASTPSGLAKSYKAEFLSFYGKDLNSCNPNKRQLIVALLESNIQGVKKLINPQNVNDVFEVRSLDTFEMGKIHVALERSLIKIPYLWIAAEAYYAAPNKNVKQQALLVVKELLKLGANPNKARTVVISSKDSSGKFITTTTVVPTLYSSIILEDPVLLELFLQHKGDLNVRISTVVSGDAAIAINTKNQSFTAIEAIKSSKSSAIKAVMRKYTRSK